MEFLISESQLKSIILEQDKSQMSDYMKILNSFTKNIVSRVSKSYGLNLRMLLTWGTSVGGMVMPLDQFIKTGNFDLTSDQRYLVLAGIAFILFFEKKKGLSSILHKIKDEGLQDVFENTLNKAKQLNTAFQNFLSSLSVVSSSFLETVSYSFLIPIIMDIQDIVHQSGDPKEAAKHIAERLIASGVVLTSSNVLTRIIKKIVNRIK